MTKLVAITQPCIPGISTAEELLVYTARVSSPQNQLDTETGPRLLRYCIRNHHWSVFEQASVTMEIECSRAIAAQILRHRGFTFQEFSQRYSEVQPVFHWAEPRGQGKSNRQAGEVEAAEGMRVAVIMSQEMTEDDALVEYRNLLGEGVAREVAREVLPLSIGTRLYVNGTIRQWIHYCDVRMEGHTQIEHRRIATECWEVLKELFPVTCAAVEEERKLKGEFEAWRKEKLTPPGL